MAGNIRKRLDNLLGSSKRSELANRTAVGEVKSVYPKVLLVIYNPTLPSEGGHQLSDIFGWNNPDRLVEQYINDLNYASYGYCSYQIMQRIETDKLPVKIDGFSYSKDDYVSAWRARAGFHIPDWADYHRILADFNIVEQVNDGVIDEVWLFAFPYAGFYESRMVGPGAFWCNSPPLEGYENISNRFIIMGFNYERGVGEMLESHGHRAESIMAYVYRRYRGDTNLWKRFVRFDKNHPGAAEVGNVHYAPNSQQDYDWGNRAKVLSRCDNWYNFPNLHGNPRPVMCSEWGNGDTRLHHLWWFRHFPHVNGVTDGILNNWWEYVIDPSRVG